MTTPVATEQFTDLARRGQEAGTAAIQDWTAALRTYADAVAPRAAQPLDLQFATTAAFDLADRVLHIQRSYVSTVVALLTEAGEAVSAQASTAGETFTARAEEARERVVDLAAQATRRTADAARNGVSV